MSIRELTLTAISYPIFLRRGHSIETANVRLVRVLSIEQMSGNVGDHHYENGQFNTQCGNELGSGDVEALQTLRSSEGTKQYGEGHLEWPCKKDNGATDEDQAWYETTKDVHNDFADTYSIRWLTVRFHVIKI